MWYAVQVATGREQVMADLVIRVAPSGLVQECFSPQYATERKVHGQFEQCVRTLLPGYLIAVTRDPAELARCLAKLPEFARVLAMGERYVPLRDDEMDLIAAFTEPGRRTVPMSRAVKLEDGDRVVVTEGPLVGHEGLISKIDRRKSMAYLTFDVCGRTVETRVGLAVVSRAAGA